VIFLDSNGQKLEDLASRDAGPMRDQITRIVQQHSRPPIAEDATVEQGLTRAREAKKLLAVLFTDPDAQETASFMETFLGQPMADMRDGLVWIKRPVHASGNHPTDEAKDHQVSRSPTLVILDPWAEGHDQQVKKITNFRSLHRDLEKAIEEAHKAGHPPADGGAAPAGGGDHH
jgi:hypothetical protein